MPSSSWTPRPAEPYQPGNVKAKKSGAWSERSVAPLAAELTAGLLADRPDLAAYPDVVTAWSRAEARCRLLADWFDDGFFKPDGEERPGIRYVVQFEKQAADLRAKLGLDPLSEAKLARDRATATAVAFDLDALAARGRAALDARRAELQPARVLDVPDDNETRETALQVPQIERQASVDTEETDDDA